MAYCKNCGNELEERSIRCEECGEVCSNELKHSDDKASILHVFIGLFLPLIGFILFIVWNAERPKSARNALIGALISLPVIFIFGIISAFMIPAVATIIDNTNQNVVYADALAVEQAADLYCADVLCSDDQEFTWSMLEPYIEGIDEAYYELNDSTVVAYFLNGNTRVQLEASGSGNWEFYKGDIPSQSSRDGSVFRDID